MYYFYGNINREHLSVVQRQSVSRRVHLGGSPVYIKLMNVNAIAHEILSAHTINNLKCTVTVQELVVLPWLTVQDTISFMKGTDTIRLQSPQTPSNCLHFAQCM